MTVYDDDMIESIGIPVLVDILRNLPDSQMLVFEAIACLDRIPEITIVSVALF